MLQMRCPIARSVIRAGAVEFMQDRLAVLGLTELGDTLVSDLQAHVAYVDRCVREAEEVLHGELSAATRLWLLLKDPVENARRLPRTVRDEIAATTGDSSLRAIDGQVMLRLVAGVVRSANLPSESEAMLDTLGQLLAPLFMLEHAASAAELATQGDPGAITTIGTICESVKLRATLIRTSESSAAVELTPLTEPVSEAGVVVDRPPFDPTGWRAGLTSKALENWDLPWQCAGSVHKKIAEVDRFGERYTIDSISNPTACAGEIVRLIGRNFGARGYVSFPAPEAGDAAFGLGKGDDAILSGVEPVSWSETQIDVAVPIWATTGQISLNGFTRVTDPCATIDVYRLGNSVLFLGGLAAVFEVNLAGRPVDLAGHSLPNLAPGDAVAVTYRATAGPSVRVRIQLVDEDGHVLLERAGMPGGYGGLVLTVPDPIPQEPRRATLIFKATSNCGGLQPLRVPVSLSVPPVLTIEYIEVTQGVQGDLTDVLAGNAMPTVANKDTAVRVHMNCDRGGWYYNILDNITGALRVDGQLLPPTNERLFAGITGLSRPNLTNDTLNFTIPAAWLTPGPHKLTVQLLCDDQSGRISIGQTITWTWAARTALGVGALYLGLYASNEQMLDYLRRALDFLPTPLTGIGIAGPVWHPHANDLSTYDGWDDLLDEMTYLWEDWDDHVRWLCIVPRDEALIQKLAWAGISHAPGLVAIAIEDLPEAGAHELGHTLGAHHVNLGRVAEHWPAPPYDTVDGGGFLRRPPFDVRTSTAIHLPTGDLMSYFGPVRPGITNWIRLYNIF